MRRRTMNPAGKRDAILEAASRHFAERGYDQTSMADIAQHADVAVGSVYRLFEDKHAVLEAVHSRVEDRFISAIRRGWDSGETLKERLTGIVANLFDAAESLNLIVRVLSEQRGGLETSATHGQRTVEAIAETIAAGMELGLARTVPVRPVAEISYGIVAGAFAGCFMRANEDQSALYRALVLQSLYDLVRPLPEESGGV